MPFLSSRAAGSVRGYGFGSAKAASVLTGGTLFSDATHNYRAFTASGSFVVSGVPLEAEILMIGGGGNSLSTYPSAGGGAGQVISYNNTLSTGTYTCTVGSAGSNSTVNVINRTASGGGSGNSGTGGTSGNGFAGGTQASSAPGGGGGATAVGGNGYQHPVYSNNAAGSGGAGTSAYSSFGSATGIGVLSGGLYYYGGGGGGQGGAQASGANPGGGGLGGGGNGSFYAFWDGVNQTNNTYANHLNNQGPANCGGGAGGFYNNQTNGNSGLIVFKYLKGAGN
jgi:hypothetical protein